MRECLGGLESVKPLKIFVITVKPLDISCKTEKLHEKYGWIRKTAWKIWLKYGWIRVTEKPKHPLNIIRSMIKQEYVYTGLCTPRTEHLFDDISFSCDEFCSKLATTFLQRFDSKNDQQNFGTITVVSWMKMKLKLYLLMKMTRELIELHPMERSLGHLKSRTKDLRPKGSPYITKSLHKGSILLNS